MTSVFTSCFSSSGKILPESQNTLKRKCDTDFINTSIVLNYVSKDENISDLDYVV